MTSNDTVRAMVERLRSFEPDEPEGVLCRNAAALLLSLQAENERLKKSLAYWINVNADSPIDAARESARGSDE
jgi:hypothetical protein